MPCRPYPLQANLEVSFNAVSAHTAQVVQSVQHMVGPGGVYRPLVLVPALSVTTTAAAGIIPLDSAQKQATVTVRVRSNMSPPATTDAAKAADLHLNLPAGWQSDPASIPFTTQAAGETQTLAFHVTPQSLSAAAYPITPVATLQGHDYATGYETVGYPGLRPYNYYPSAPYKLVGIDVKVAKGINVGYVMGTGDDVPQALESLGVPVHLLPPAEIAAGKLDAYDVIVLGIRAYAARPELVAANSRLLAYVKQGGVLIVQYNTREFDHNYGPYPIGPHRRSGKGGRRDRPGQATRCRQPLAFLAQRHHARRLRRLGRGAGPRLHPHLGRALRVPHGDARPRPGRPEGRPTRGQIRQGHLGLRSLRPLPPAPEGVPGAYRLFANLLSLPKYNPPH